MSAGLFFPEASALSLKPTTSCCVHSAVVSWVHACLPLSLSQCSLLNRIAVRLGLSPNRPHFRASLVATVVKNLPANAGDIRDAGSIPGSERSPGGGHGNPLQCSCLENPMDRGAWRAIVDGVSKSATRLKRLSMHTSPF